MKYIQTFENFETHDERTPTDKTSIGVKAKQYVEDNFSGNNFLRLFKLLGVEVPKEQTGEQFDEACDKVRDMAVKHFTDNPEEMTIQQPEIKRSGIDTGSNVPLMQNMGGSYTQKSN